MPLPESPQASPPQEGNDRQPPPAPAIHPTILPEIPNGGLAGDLYNGLSMSEWPFLIPPGTGPTPQGRASAPIPSHKTLGDILDDEGANIPPPDGYSVYGNSSTTSSIIEVSK